MNFSKYSGTAHIAPNFSSNSANLNNSLGNYNSGGPSMKRQGGSTAIAPQQQNSSGGGASGQNRQEQSVERLKTCIADLKKLAQNKVKRGGGV
jgi:hypothetical protein